VIAAPDRRAGPAVECSLRASAQARTETDNGVARHLVAEFIADSRARKPERLTGL
jgi:hypothetical protein